MADGIAEIDEECVYGGYGGGPGAPYDRVGRFPSRYYSSTSSEYSWSECSCSSSWCSCESDEYFDCCGGYGTCREEMWMEGGCGFGNGFNSARGRPDAVQATQGCTVIQNNHNQNKGVRQAKHPKAMDVRSPESLEWERGLRMEDAIYYLAKRERHRNDERRRIQDWMRVMGDLEGGDGGGKKARYPRDERYRDFGARERSRGGYHVNPRERDGVYLVDADDDGRGRMHRSEPVVNDVRRERSRRESRERMYDEYGGRYRRDASQERVRGRGRLEDDYWGFRRR